MFSTDYAHRPQKGPSRPTTPINRPHSLQALKAEPSLRHSSSSGWGWPRRVSVEVDIEEKRRGESHEAPRMTEPEQPVDQESVKGNLPSGSSEYSTASSGDKQPVQTQDAESEEQSRASAVDQEPGEKQIHQVQGHEDPSQTRPSDLRTLSPARSDGSSRSRGAFTADEFPMSEPTRSPAVSVRRVGSGSPNSDRTMQLLEADTGNQTAELTDASENPDRQALRSDQMQSNEPGEEDLQPPKAKDLTPDAQTELLPKDNVPTRSPRSEKHPLDSEYRGRKRSSVSASAGKPPGSFPGAYSSSEEQPALEEDTATDEEDTATDEAAAVPKASENQASEQPALDKEVVTDEPVAVPQASKDQASEQPALNKKAVTNEPAVVPEASEDQASEQPALAKESATDEPAVVPEASEDQAAAGPKYAETEDGKGPKVNEAGSPNEPVDSPHVWSGMLPQGKDLAQHKGGGNPELGSTENESNKPHVTFKGDDPSQPVSEPKVSTDHLPQEPNTKEYGKEPNGQPLAKPQGSTAYGIDRFSNASDYKRTEQIRRPSRDSLRTRSRKPSVYIPLSKVAEAKGKIESANVQPPRSGEIINAEAMPSPHSTEIPKEIAPDSHATLPDDTQKAAYLNDGELSHDTPVIQREPAPNPGPSQTNATEITPPSTVSSPKENFDDRQSTATPSPPDNLSQEGTKSRRSSVVRREMTPEGFIRRISTPSEQTTPDSPTKSHKSKRRSVQMSLPPPKIVVQSPSSASELPEPLTTPAVPVPADEYKIKSRSGTIVSVEHTVHGAADKLSQTPPKKQKNFLRKVRNIVARRAILNAALGRQMGARTKRRLRQLAKGEELPSSPIPAQENAPDLPPLRKRQSFIRKARNLAARQAFLDATLGRQVAAETKPVLRRMANGEMVVVEEGHSYDVKR